MGVGVAAGMVVLAATGLWAAVTTGGTQTKNTSKSVITIPTTKSSKTGSTSGKTATTTSLMAMMTTSTSGTATATTTGTPSAALPGINISGGEFGGSAGRLGYDYIYPSATEMRSYAAQGFKVLRVPFRWERLQPSLYGPLSETDRKALKSVVTQANSLGLTVVLDMHNYGQRQLSGKAATLGSGELAATALTNAWVMIMEDYRSNPNVWIGLMNEPNKQSPQIWWDIARQVTKDLRAQKIDNKLLVPGTAWTGAHNWIGSGNAAQADSFVDPANNFAFEVHQYLDAWSTGTTDICETDSGKRVNAILSWAETRKVQLFFGEIAASGQPQCAIEYADMLQRLNHSPSVLAWTAWGGGAWWGANYMFRLQSRTETMTPHLSLLLSNMR